MMESVKAHMRCKNGNTINHVFPIQYDFNGYWVAITQLEGDVKLIDQSKGSKFPNTPLYLCCDICEESYMSGQDGKLPKSLPILMELPSVIGNMDLFITEFLWYKVTNPFISHIKLYIVDETGTVPTFRSCDLRCSVLFARKKGWK